MNIFNQIIDRNFSSSFLQNIVDEQKHTSTTLNDFIYSLENTVQLYILAYTLVCFV